MGEKANNNSKKQPQKKKIIPRVPLGIGLGINNQ